MKTSRKFRIGDRIEARRNAPREEDAALTDEDKANLDSFAAKLAEATSLLRMEIAGITRDNLNVVNDVYEEKAAVLKWLELRMPLVDPFLHHEEARLLDLPGLLAEFQRAAKEDTELLSRMAIAANTIVREYEKASDRNGLSGNYGKSGHKFGAEVDSRIQLDREL